jgi:hypothetical protein
MRTVYLASLRIHARPGCRSLTMATNGLTTVRHRRGISSKIFFSCLRRGVACEPASPRARACSTQHRERRKPYTDARPGGVFVAGVGAGAVPN